MKILCVLMVSLSGVHLQYIWVPEQLTGGEGGSVNINCSYARSVARYMKYWCMVKLKDSTILTSTYNTIPDSRISIQDNRFNLVFYVAMAALREEDKGWYQCVIDQFPSLIGQHHTVSLNVIKASRTTSDPPHNSPTEASDIKESSHLKMSKVWSILSWVLFALMLACTLMVSWWNRSPTSPTSTSGVKPKTSVQRTPQEGPFRHHPHTPPSL